MPDARPDVAPGTRSRPARRGGKSAEMPKKQAVFETSSKNRIESPAFYHRLFTI
jgi:hypothetical protein